MNDEFLADEAGKQKTGTCQGKAKGAKYLIEEFK